MHALYINLSVIDGYTYKKQKPSQIINKLEFNHANTI